MTRDFWLGILERVYALVAMTAFAFAFLPWGQPLEWWGYAILVAYVILVSLLLARTVGGIIGYFLIRQEVKRKVQGRGTA